MESGFTEATVLGFAGAAFMFALAVHAAGRSGAHGAGAFAAWSATAGLRLLADTLFPWLPEPWRAAAGVLSHLTTWIAPLLLLLFALRFAAEAGGAHRWRAGPFWWAGAIASVIVVTNPIHGAYLRSGWSDVTVDFAPLGWVMVAIGNAVVLAVVVLLAVRIVRAPHRWAPLSLVIVGVGLNLAVTVLPLFAWSPFGFGHVDVVVRAVAAGLFAVALFGFGLLRLAPIGREAVLQRMDEGWLVLDPGGRIADLNPAAARLLRLDARSVIGRPAQDALDAVPGLDAVWRADATDPVGVDARVGDGSVDRHLDVHVTPLLGRGGTLLGRTVLVRDVTALRRAEARGLEHERALAALQERERVARELHDGLAQVLGFVRLQAEAARGLVRRDPTTADAYLDHLAAAAQEAHGEVRAFISGSVAASGAGFLASMEAALRRLRDEVGIEVDLQVAAGLDDDAVTPPVAAHVVRIVQEALHNVRKHARAHRVTVAVDTEDGHVRIVISDDGVGLDDAADPAVGAGFGLRFMQERAAAAGGSLTVGAHPDGGTRVTLRVPRAGAPDAARTPPAEPVAAGRRGG